MIVRGSWVPSSMPSRCRKRAGGDVADHHLDRDDLDLADQLLAHVEPADEMGRDADRAEQGEDMLGDAVVEHALAGDRALLLGVEGGRVVLEILDQRAGLGPFVEDLGLAFVDQSAAGHGRRGLRLEGRSEGSGSIVGQAGAGRGQTALQVDLAAHREAGIAPAFARPGSPPAGRRRSRCPRSRDRAG